MKHLLFILILGASLYSEPATKDDIRLLIEQMDKRFEQMDRRFDQVDKRFEAVQHNMDKRFELMQNNMDKRFETVFNILYILMGLVFASPFIAIYLRDKKENEDKKHFDTIKGILFTLIDFAQDNEKIAKSLRASNLL